MFVELCNWNVWHICQFLYVGCSLVTVEILPYANICSWDIDCIEICSVNFCIREGPFSKLLLISNVEKVHLGQSCVCRVLQLECLAHLPVSLCGLQSSYCWNIAICKHLQLRYWLYWELLCQEICALLPYNPCSVGVVGSDMMWHCRLVVASECEMVAGTALNLSPY